MCVCWIICNVFAFNIDFRLIKALIVLLFVQYAQLLDKKHYWVHRYCWHHYILYIVYTEVKQMEYNWIELIKQIDLAWPFLYPVVTTFMSGHLALPAANPDHQRPLTTPGSGSTITALTYCRRFEVVAPSRYPLLCLVTPEHGGLIMLKFPIFGEQQWPLQFFYIFYRF